MSTGRVQVLVIGLDPARVPGPWDTAPVVRAIERGMARFDEVGIGVRSVLLGLDGADVVDEAIGTVTAALRTGTWDVVVVGGGLRTDDQVLLLETVVNLVRVHAPRASIAFNDSPERTLEAAQRQLAGG